MSRKALAELGSRQKKNRLRGLIADVDPPLPLNGANHGFNEGNAEPILNAEEFNRHVADHLFNENNPERNFDAEEFNRNYDNVSSNGSEIDAVASEEENENNHEENIFEEDNSNNEPLYRGAPLSVADSMLLIQTIRLRHNLTSSCIADIISIINLHCPEEGLKKNSLYKFENFFSIGRDISSIKHFYCTSCNRELPAVESVCPSCPRKNNSYFIQLPFLDQLKELYKRDVFYDRLQLRFQRPMMNIISDVYDGVLYQTWTDNGFLSNPHNISFSWYTDGIPIFKSSQISAWPLYLSINELPFEDRKKRENTLLLGLWYGDNKPNMNKFLMTFYDDFMKISDGIEVYIPKHDITINVKGVLLMGTCDLPAKSQCLNFVQFNGHFGCPFCLCKGENIPIIPRGTVHVYPYENQLILRDTATSIVHANQATLGQSIMGVKGPTALSRMMPDFIKGTAIDRMHCVDSGVVKKMLNLWFSVDYRTYDFSLYTVIDIVNTRLTAIQPPKFVHRMPRTLNDLAHWKASELKMWLFYYSIPVLRGILNPNYFDHYLLLVTAISILNSDVITPQMLEIARDLLHKFVKEFESLYGLRFCSINVHQLLHLPDIVKNLGPLWVHSCYEYENINGQIVKLIHGTNHIDTQVAKSQFHFMKMASLIDKQVEGDIRDFCLKKKHQVKVIERVDEKCYAIGAYKRLIQLPPIIEAAVRNLELSPNCSIRQYSRLLKNGKLFIATTYKSDLQTHSSVVQYFDNDKLGLVYCFIKVINCNCVQHICLCPNRHFAVMKQILCHEVIQARGNRFVNDTRAFLRKCHVTNNIMAVPLAHLINVCVYMNIDNEVYVGIPVNEKELE